LRKREKIDLGLAERREGRKKKGRKKGGDVSPSLASQGRSRGVAFYRGEGEKRGGMRGKEMEALSCGSEKKGREKKKKKATVSYGREERGRKGEGGAGQATNGSAKKEKGVSAPAKRCRREKEKSSGRGEKGGNRGGMPQQHHARGRGEERKRKKASAPRHAGS